MEGYKSGKVMQNDVLCSCSEIKVLQNGKLNYNYELLLCMLLQGSTLRKNFISPAGLVTVTFTSPETLFLALIMISIITFSKY